MASLLIYIPAYKNHLALAIQQATKLKDQWNSSELCNSDHKIEIYLSINGLDEDLDIPEGLFDYLYHSRINIGWDNNMNKGFVEALRIRPDYFWLLSCDDSVAHTAVETIFQSFEINRAAKLIVTKNGANFENDSISKIFDISPDYSLGLISSIVYNYKYCEKAFPASYYFGWSGWGQLSVLIKILDIYESINVISVDSKFLYNRIQYTHEGTHIGNFSKYQHSYYGNLLLRLANSKGRLDNKRIVFRWVTKNLRYHNIYASVSWPNTNEQDAPESVNWRKFYTAFSIKGISMLSYTLYFIFTKIPVRFVFRKWIN
jgi:hypothetical protein